MEKGTAWTLINLFVVGVVLPEAKGVTMEQKIGERFYEELERRRAAEPRLFPRMIVSREDRAEDGLRPEDYELEQRR